ncbi:MAG TPA: hypothetical protein VFC53_02785 [Dehalococcoidia bacterium]|nr:hypothetical protein [Dehalococcoidia bacterium]
MKRIVLAAVAIAIAMGAALLALHGATSGQQPAYQQTLAGLRAGKILHLHDTVYRAPAAERGVHAPPENYLSDIWLRYADGRPDLLCSVLSDTAGSVLQTSVYNPMTRVLTTNFADGTRLEQEDYGVYSLAEAEQNLASLPGASGPTSGTPVTATLSSGKRRETYYDEKTGEYEGEDLRENGALTFRLRRTTELFDSPPTELQRCLGSDATPGPQPGSGPAGSTAAPHQEASQTPVD